jgi:hypothetical protein
MIQASSTFGVYVLFFHPSFGVPLSLPVSIFSILDGNNTELFVIGVFFTFPFFFFSVLCLSIILYYPMDIL